MQRITYPAAEQHNPVAQLWPPLLPHLSIEPVAVGTLIVEALEVGPAELEEGSLDVTDAVAEEYMDPAAAMTAEESSRSNGFGTKVDIEGGPLGLPEPQSLRSVAQKPSQLPQFLLPVGPAEL